MPEGSTLLDRGEGIMTMSEYEERSGPQRYHYTKPSPKLEASTGDDCGVDPSGSLQPWSV